MYALLILGKFVRDQSKVRAGLTAVSIDVSGRI